ncbi:uncharacterized protein LOC111692321 [Anoplophora glabripennis]|uniref:uncharacterized protein LOC111692321 n=1 Tax=Anoplophora glabripennis TaxID=217634 RepID=UPI000C771789|nr:uncharacterized protein LOC111692321 [Anoplophora glabripennis]
MDSKYAVIQFEEKNEISVIPVNWMNEQIRKSFWPKTLAKNQRTLIIKCVKPEENWPLFEIKNFFGKYDTYEETLQVEKHAAASSSESEEILQRAPGKRKVKSKLT